MTNDIDVIEKVINSKVAEKVYDDGVSPAAIELGKLGQDLAKTARLILAPIQIAASFQDRFASFLEKLNRSVPDENLIEIPAELSSVCIEKMKYLDVSNPLWLMFEELLIKASNKETIGEVHPAFGYIIGQLSPDEAFMLQALNSSDFEIVDTMDLNKRENRFVNRQIETSTVPEEHLANPEALSIYYAHLESMSLVNWPVLKQTPIYEPGNNPQNQIGTRRETKIQLTDFGKLFVTACVPKDGFN
ncbi:Abi-alpha family protein [Mariprofundus ferrooxydans]|uniref:DUF4393 domain-containing protein n=1 Tax=Mariprofundus ferrooxydans PV-1 TaxID=314345 RepID=Q0F0Z8_9PROT|nr:Abi-alpha family protein [Mariprofundus ferrooxydans]EAU55393.1 hypothetical protein SPV1_11691 [Mariprofundus ferrooxydans PV-1]KON47691.1 hypothetical protein AL013_06890 [Mariprofundus ferrooxydans]